jgi:beta-glucosidase
VFPRGYGLTLAASTTVAALPEDPHVPADRRARNTLFAAGHVTAPWSIYVADRSGEVRLTMQTQDSPERALRATLAGGAVRADWSGAAAGEFRIGGRAADDSRLAAEMALVLRYRVGERPTQPVSLGLRCEAPYGAPPPPGMTAVRAWRKCGVPAGATLDLTAQFKAAAPGRWLTLEVPFVCFTRNGADLSNVNAPLALETAGRFSVSIASARIARPAATESCPGEAR